MSMALFYTALTRQEYEDVLADKIQCDEIEDRADLDYYSMEILDYLPESDSPLFALLTASEGVSALEEKVQFGRLMDEGAIDYIIDAFKQTDLKEFADEMGYPEEESLEVSNSLYKTLVKLQKFFETAKANNKVIVNWAG